MGPGDHTLPSVQPMGMMFGMPESSGYAQELPQQVDLAKNPLAETHEFKHACGLCYIKTGKKQSCSATVCLLVETCFHRACHSHNSAVSAGPGVLDYTYNSEEHKCKKDLLIGRIKHGENPTWKLIRPRPTKNQYMGLYYICKGEWTVSF